MTSVLDANTSPLAGPNVRAAKSGRGRQVGQITLSWLVGLPAGAVAALVSPVVERSLLAIILFNIPLQIEKHFCIREDVRDLGSIGGLCISVTTIALAGLYLGWLLKIALRRLPASAGRQRCFSVTLPAILFLLVSASSILIAEDPGLGAFAVWNTLQELLVCLYVARFVTRRNDVLFVLRLLLIGLLFESALMVAQAGGLVADIDSYGFKARAFFAGDHRVSGTLGSPNPGAAYLAMMMTLSVGVLFGRQKWGDKLLAALGLAGAALALIFTLSRGGWCAFLAGFVIVIAFGGSRARRKGAVVAGLLAILLVLPLAPAIGERLAGDDNGSGAARMPLNRLALAMIADHPLLGVGANNFPVAMQPYVAHDFSGEFLYCVHNAYLLVCSETGLIGCFIFVWFLVAVVREGIRRAPSHDGAFGLAALGCAAAVIGLMVQMNVDPLRTGPAIDLLWLFAGLVVAMKAIDERDDLTEGLLKP